VNEKVCQGNDSWATVVGDTLGLADDGVKEGDTDFDGAGVGNAVGLPVLGDAVGDFVGTTVGDADDGTGVGTRLGGIGAAVGGDVGGVGSTETKLMFTRPLPPCTPCWLTSTWQPGPQ